MSKLPSWSRSSDVSASTTVTFSGLRILPWNEISVVVDSDNNGKVTLEQGIDASNYQFTTEKHVYANKPGDYKFPVLSEYGRLKFENLGATDTSLSMASYGLSNGNSNIYNSDANILLVDNLNFAAAATSDSVNIQHLKELDVFGNADPSTNITVQYSYNDSNFYDTIHTVAASGDFHMNFSSGSKYMRLKNTGAVDTSLTAVVAGKY